MKHSSGHPLIESTSQVSMPGEALGGDQSMLESMFSYDSTHLHSLHVETLVGCGDFILTTPTELLYSYSVSKLAGFTGQLALWVYIASISAV